MLLLTVLASFAMFTIILLIGITIGYMLGFKNDRSLKQQIGKLKTTIKTQNKSAQLKELTTKELQERSDWDFRSKLASITGQAVTTPDTQVNDDPASMDRTF